MRGLPTTVDERRSRPDTWRSLLTPQGLAKYVRNAPRETAHWYRNLSRTSKRTIWYVTAAHFVALLLVVIITPTRIGQWFNAFAMHLRKMGLGGMFLLGFLVVLSSHPPLIGFSGSMTLIGFTWGLWPGFLIASISSLIGGAIAFLSVRRFFLSWVRKRSNAKWDAFGRVMRDKGLPLVIMIRYCPLPWALSNGLFASVESVKFWHYMVASVCLQPRLLIPVFIGSRLVSLTEESPSHDPLQFWLNLLSIGLSFTFSVGTGYTIYRLTLEQMRKMDEDGGGVGMEGELAAEAFENGGLMDNFSDEEIDEPLTVRSEALRPGGGIVRRTSSGSDV